VDAAKLMYKYEEEDDFIKYNESILGILRDIQPDETLHLDFEGREFFAPMDLDELLVLRKNHPDAKILAGGTDIGLTLTKGGQVLQKLISVEHVEELHLSNLTKEYVELGASVSLSDVLDTLKQHIPQFASLVTRIGSVQIRNQGTMGGNLVNASPIGDSAPLLLALDATVTIKSLESERELALSDFFTGYRMTALKPGEILYSIKVPIPTDSVFRCYKVSKRFDQDISTVCGAFTLKLNRENIVTDFRAAFGGMAATPIRATQVEALLLGKPWDEKNAKLASDKLKEELHPMTDFRGSSDYRSKVAGNLIFRFYLETCGSDEYMEVISYE
jgi:xanthine dehydrogenase small subunit